MEKVERYTFPAVFTYEEGREIAVVFPDLDVATSGTDDSDALLSARELLGCALYGMEEDGEDIPAPTPLSDVFTAENERAVLVDVYMPSIRMAKTNRSVNCTVKKTATERHRSLEERPTAFYGKPVEEIERIDSREVDWGKAEEHKA